MKLSSTRLLFYVSFVSTIITCSGESNSGRVLKAKKNLPNKNLPGKNLLSKNLQSKNLPSIKAKKKSKVFKLKIKKSKNLKSKHEFKGSKSKRSKKPIPKSTESPTKLTTGASNAPTNAPTFSAEGVAAVKEAFNILRDLKNDLLPYYDLLLPEFHGFLDDFIAGIRAVNDQLKSASARFRGKTTRRLQKTRDTQADLLADVAGIISSAFDALGDVLTDIPGVDLGDSLAAINKVFEEFEETVGEFTNPPTELPTELPTKVPTELPTEVPTKPTPSRSPTLRMPSVDPFPTSVPSSTLSASPSVNLFPTSVPSSILSAPPSVFPTSVPSSTLSAQPSVFPTSVPSSILSAPPSVIPTYVPSSTLSAPPSVDLFRSVDLSNNWGQKPGTYIVITSYHDSFMCIQPSSLSEGASLENVPCTYDKSDIFEVDKYGRLHTSNQNLCVTANDGSLVLDDCSERTHSSIFLYDQNNKMISLYIDQNQVFSSQNGEVSLMAPLFRRDGTIVQKWSVISTSTSAPSSNPTAFSAPSVPPTLSPTPSPTEKTTDTPTALYVPPTSSPAPTQTDEPTDAPTALYVPPTSSPTPSPTEKPTDTPTALYVPPTSS
eukprot:CAMPEP_0194265434 /NCGR_PEP_ID=MMETSP0169-20130528/680_1 /TAXON_ID=218684 /ORGANISM="Corethron pennatum, Strain L29A3" /LENGTH=602 /DNA_ID=CAMNT_0039005899 /DNA_START=153 /DNA_END=1957 /DNA_ORIENTATION=-